MGARARAYNGVRLRLRIRSPLELTRNFVMRIKYLSMLRILVVLLDLGLLVLAAPVHAQTGPAAATLTGAQCEALVRADYSQVEDAPAKILAAKAVAGAGDLPSYCEVIGYVWHNVEFRVPPLASQNEH